MTKKLNTWLVTVEGDPVQRIWIIDAAISDKYIRGMLLDRFGRRMAQAELLAAGEFLVVGPCLRCYVSPRRVCSKGSILRELGATWKRLAVRKHTNE